MMFLRILGLCFLTAAKASDNCSWTVDGDVLDLSYFPRNNIMMAVYATSAVYFYEYTPCQNASTACPGGVPGMISQINAYENGCYVFAYWDQGATAPKHHVSASGVEKWTFTYQNGNVQGLGCGSYLNVTYRFIVQWSCNKTVDYVVASITEISWCVYQMDIDSKYACSTQPPPAGGDCVWQTADKQHALNLTLVKDMVISNVAQDNNNQFNIYRYTPCGNALQCNETAVMTDVSNLATGDCLTYLAKWEGGQVYHPTYSEQHQAWQFVYLSGETCDGLQSTTQILWICDPMAGQFKMMKSERVSPCVYEMAIHSKYACD